MSIYGSDRSAPSGGLKRETRPSQPLAAPAAIYIFSQFEDVKWYPSSQSQLS